MKIFVMRGSDDIDSDAMKNIRENLYSMSFFKTIEIICESVEGDRICTNNDDFKNYYIYRATNISDSDVILVLCREISHLNSVAFHSMIWAGQLGKEVMVYPISGSVKKVSANIMVIGDIVSRQHFTTITERLLNIFDHCGGPVHINQYALNCIDGSSTKDFDSMIPNQSFLVVVNYINKVNPDINRCIELANGNGVPIIYLRCDENGTIVFD